MLFWTESCMKNRFKELVCQERNNARKQLTIMEMISLVAFSLLPRLLSS